MMASSLIFPKKIKNPPPMLNMSPMNLQIKRLAIHSMPTRSTTGIKFPILTKSVPKSKTSAIFCHKETKFGIHGTTSRKCKQWDWEQQAAAVDTEVFTMRWIFNAGVRGMTGDVMLYGQGWKISKDEVSLFCRYEMAGIVEENVTVRVSGDKLLMMVIGEGPLVYDCVPGIPKQRIFQATLYIPMGLGKLEATKVFMENGVLSLEIPKK